MHNRFWSKWALKQNEILKKERWFNSDTKRENQKETKTQSFITQSERFQTDVLDESTNIKELVIEKSKLMIWQHAAFHTIGSKS